MRIHIQVTAGSIRTPRYPAKNLLNTLLAVISAILIASCTAGGLSRSTTGGIVTFESPGNLKATDPLDCVSYETISNTHTAADIAAGMKKCLMEGEFDRAAELMRAADAFAYFDTLRVTDLSAHAALSALFVAQAEGTSLSDRQALLSAVESLTAETDRSGHLCEVLSALDPPDYYPTYMIAHGLAAFIPENDEPPLQEIDRANGWREALGYIDCLEP